MTTQLLGDPGACPAEKCLKYGSLNGISCILSALLSKIYRFEIPF